MSKLYHLTDADTAEIILRTQRMQPGSSGLAGGGIYFATTAELTGHKAHKKGVILEATVALGKMLTLTAVGDPTMTLQKLKSMGFDSVCIARPVSSGQEYVVYDPGQVMSIDREDGQRPPPSGLKLEGGSLTGDAVNYPGTYRLVVGKLVNGRPAYQHTSDATRWIAFVGNGWMGQPESSLGEKVGFLDLQDSAAATPDVSTMTWKAAGGAGSEWHWVEAPQLKCTAWTPPPAGLKVKLENGPQVTRMHVGDAIALLSHAVHNDPPSEAVQKLCTPFIASQFHELQSAGQAQLHLLPPKIVVDLLDMNCLNVKSEDQVFRMIRAYIGARKDVVDWQAQLWSTCRFCSITPATLEVALTIAEIPPQSIQLGMLARIYHTEYDKYRTDYDSFIAKHSPAGQNAGDRSARGDRLRARRAQ